MELTVHWDCASNMALLVQRKTERYQGLASAIEENGYKCFNTSLEIGTREVINHRNWAVINLLCLVMKIKKINNLITTCSKLALLGSYTLLNARYSTDWSFGGYVKHCRAATYFPPNSQFFCTIIYIKYLPPLTYVFSQLMHCHCSASQALGMM